MVGAGFSFLGVGKRKSRDDKFQSEEEELVDGVLFPLGKFYAIGILEVTRGVVATWVRYDRCENEHEHLKSKI